MGSEMCIRDRSFPQGTSAKRRWPRFHLKPAWETPWGLGSVSAWRAQRKAHLPRNQMCFLSLSRPLSAQERSGSAREHSRSFPEQPGALRGRPRSAQERSRSAREHFPELPGSAQEASGSVQEHPWSSRSVQEAPCSFQGGSGEFREAPKLVFLCFSEGKMSTGRAGMIWNVLGGFWAAVTRTPVGGFSRARLPRGS